jgi:hypothetical protein
MDLEKVECVRSANESPLVRISGTVNLETAPKRGLESSLRI